MARATPFTALTRISRFRTRIMLRAPSSCVAIPADGNRHRLRTGISLPSTPQSASSTASATIASIVSSKRAITTDARIAVPRLTTSHVKPRARDGHDAVGNLLVADTGQRAQVLFRLFLDHVNDVVDG